ncbi:MAG: inositol monophosphatase family protein [Bacillota bacterium]
MQELKLLIGIANEVSAFIQENYYQNQVKFLKQYDYTNVSGDLQKGIDDIVNNKIIDLIKAAGIPAIIISEETGIIKLTDNPRFYLLLDPIDGSNNVRPWFTPYPSLVISMGLGLLSELEKQSLDSIDISIVKEIFSPNTYYSIAKKGTFFTNQKFEHKLSTANTIVLQDSPIIGVDLDKRGNVESNLIELISHKIIVRRLGSTILDICQVAAGQYDAYISTGRRLKVTDVCQPYALLKEAGGMMEVIPFYKGQLFERNFLLECIGNQNLLNDIRFNIIAAGNKVLFNQIKEIIN